MLRRAGLMVITATLLAGSLSACSSTNTYTTNMNYDASDGVNVDLIGLKVRNLLVVSGGEGQPAGLNGTVFNDTAEDKTITVALESSSPVEVKVPASGSIRLEGDGTTPGVRLDKGPRTGGMVQVSIGSDVVNVPVLPATGIYASGIPTGDAKQADSSDAAEPSASPAG